MTENKIQPAPDEPAAPKELGSAFDLLGRSFEIVKKYWYLFAVVYAIDIIITIFDALNPYRIFSNQNIDSSSTSVSGLNENFYIGVAAVSALVALVVYIYLFVARTSLEVKTTAGKSPTLSEILKDGAKYFFPLLGLVIFSIVIILLGLLLLIVPGIIAIGRLALAPYFLVEGLSMKEALKKSNQLGKQYFGKVWAAIGVMILIGIGAGVLGLVPIVGTLAGTAMFIAYSLVVPLRYQQLKKLG